MSDDFSEDQQPNRPYALRILKANYTSLIKKLNQEPNPRIVGIEEFDSRSRDLELDRFGLSGHDCAALFSALQPDTYFEGINVASNNLEDATVNWLAKLIEVNGSRLRNVILRDNQFSEEKLAELNDKRKFAFLKYNRQWLIFADGNQGTDTTVKRLRSSMAKKTEKRPTPPASQAIVETGSQELQESADAVQGPLSQSESLYSSQKRQSQEFEQSEFVTPQPIESQQSDSFTDSLPTSLSATVPAVAPRPEAPPQRPEPRPRRDEPEEPQEPEPPSVEIMSNEHVLNLSERDFPACPSISNPKTNLQRLCLSHNKIRKITGLPETLVALDISNNQMTDLQIDLLENLEQLDVSNNRITQIRGFAKNRKIRELDLSCNRIARIKNLERLPSLQRLNLEKNFIDSKAAIRTLSLNSQLYLLILRGNPIYIQAQYRAMIRSMLPNVQLLDYERNGTRVADAEVFFTTPILADLTTMPVEESKVVAVSGPTPSGKKKRAPVSAGAPRVKQQAPTPAAAKPKGIRTVNPRLYQPKKVEPPKPVEVQQPTPKITEVARRPFPAKREHEEARESKFKPRSEEEETRALDYLSEIQFFQSIPASFLEATMGLCKRRRGSIGEILEAKGENCTNLAVVFDGKLQYNDRELEPGAIVHPEALLQITKLPDNLLCLERSEVLLLPKREFDLMLRQYPAYQEEILKQFRGITSSRSGQGNRHMQSSRSTIKSFSIAPPSASSQGSGTSLTRFRPKSRPKLKSGRKPSSPTKTLSTPSPKPQTPPQLSPTNPNPSQNLEFRLASLEDKIESLSHLQKEGVEMMRQARESEELHIASIYAQSQRRYGSEARSSPRASILDTPGKYGSPTSLPLQMHTPQQIQTPAISSDPLRGLEDNSLETITKMLEGWIADITEDLGTVQLTMQNLCQGEHSQPEVAQYVEILNECDMLVQKQDPLLQIRAKIGDDAFNDSSVKALVSKTSKANSELNTAKQYLGYILEAVRSGDHSKVAQLHEEALAFGVLQPDVDSDEENRPCIPVMDAMSSPRSMRGLHTEEDSNDQVTV